MFQTTHPNRPTLRGLGLLLATFLIMTDAQAHETSQPKVTPFGSTKSGEKVDAITIGNGKLSAKVITYGATLVQLITPDRDGKMTDVVLGWDDVAGYESNDNQYFGCTTGRVCNRIAGGKFTLNGKSFQLAVNNGPNHLHGGVDRSLSKVVWAARPFENPQGQGVELSYTSPDGEEGYPGNLQIKVTYFVPQDAATLRIDYWAKTDKPTPVNLTNHSYFNLSGAGSLTVLDHLLTIQADSYTPTDETLIPTGEIKSVEGTPLDFRTPRPVGQRMKDLIDTAWRGYDHNYVLKGTDLRPQPDGISLRSAAVLTDPKSGRSLAIATNQPGIQFYSGNFLMGQTAKDGKTYAHQSAVCLETQHFPDSVNHPEFPSTILKPGEEFSSRTEFSFSIVPSESRSKSVNENNEIPIDIDVQNVKKQLDEGSIVLIDCREPSECKVARIEGSVLIPLSDLRSEPEKFSEYKGKRIVVHCHHGGRSLRLTNWLRENGFPDAQNMAGGIDAWSEEIDHEVPRY